MGKKKGKKVDPEKKAALEARKEAKVERTARKRQQKEGGGEVDDDSGAEDESDNLDTLLRQYQAADKAIATTTVETLDSFPLPRANATLTLYEDTKKKNAELYCFGGEYFDGLSNIFLNHLLKYDIGKNEWKQIYCPVSPPPRCAHSCVYYNHALYVFGGEISRAEQYHHYKDLWRYDIKEQTWEELKPSKALGSHPTARSGHVAVVWKSYMVIFGGFLEANKETPRWYNEVFVMNLQTQQWLDIPHSKLSVRPEPRSACNAAVIGDDAVIHGGFSKLSKSALQLQKAEEMEVRSETKVHTDSWILHLKPLLSGKPPTWERLTSTVQRTARTVSRSPNGRAAMASGCYKNRMLAFGGVFDTEALHHKVNSIFYNDVYAMDIERRKWFAVVVRDRERPAQQGGRRKKDTRAAATTKDATTTADEGESEEDVAEDSLSEDEVNTKDSGWNLDKLRSNMFAFIDGDGNLVYEKIGDDSEGESSPPSKSIENKAKEEEEEEQEEEKEEEGKEEGKEEEKEDSSEDEPEVNRSCAATDTFDFPSSAHQGIKNSSVMKLNSKTKQPEAVSRTEPLPRINSSMVVTGNTLFVYGGLLEVGDREITLDDMWTLDLKKRQTWNCLWPGTMHKQVWRGAVHDDDDSYYSTDNKTDRGADDEDEEEKAEIEQLEANKKDRLKLELRSLRDTHGLADPDRTPAPGEGLIEFYTRTSDYWNHQADLSKETGVSSKEIKRQGFALAKDRFESVEDVLERFTALELEYRKEKKAKKDKNKEKKDR